MILRVATVGVALLAAVPAARALEPSQVFEKVSPSVWMVLTAGTKRMAGLGSAVVVGPGRLVTNCHVLVKAKAVFVRRQNVFYEARLEHADAPRDLCLLSVENFNAPAVTIAPPDSIKVGEKVFAIGNPLGMEATLSEGLVSALRVQWRGGAEVGEVLQTTAPISPGSSGGGLFDSEGRLVGITQSALEGAGAQNINFALPAQWIAEVPARAEAALAKRKAGASASRAGDAAPPGYPATGTVWIYGFSERAFAKRNAKVAIRADHVERDVVEESVYRPDGDAALVRRTVRTGDMRFLYYPLIADAALLEFAPYLLAPAQNEAPAADFVPSGYVTHEVTLVPSGDWKTTVRRDDWQVLTVPAGTYRAIHYEISGNRTTDTRASRTPVKDRFQVDVWYSPDVRRIVKEQHQAWASATKLDDALVELLEYRPPR